MNIGITGLREVIEKFEQMPDEVRGVLRAALRASLRDIQEYARSRHKFTTRSGETEREINYRTDGRNLSGVIYLNSAVGVYQHEGTGVYGPRRREIVITPRHKTILRWPDAGGTGFHFARRVVIKGIKPDPFLYSAAEHERPAIQTRFAAAIKKIVEG